MNFLPIAGRELRVASRKRSTFWVRVAGAATGLVIGSGAFVITALQGSGAAQVGSVLFYILTWMAFVAALSTGLFFTSDCLSEEKREGTIGFLFLTDLRGYDVVLGKMMSTSLRGFYGLLAVLPIIGLTQFMGGISGLQYGKSCLAIINVLFVSIGAGMLVSALSRDSQKALGVTLMLLLVIALGGPVADGIIADLKKRPFTAHWSLTSPAYVLVTASAWGRSPYWKALMITHCAGWGMLAAACALVPHTWQERRQRADSADGRGLSYALRYGSAGARERLRRKLVERWPITWLTSREQWQARLVWAAALLVVAGFFAIFFSQAPREGWIVWNHLGGLFKLLLYLWLASQACRFFVEARRGGFLELLLVTPVTEKSIVSEQWRALLRKFALPVLLLAGVHVAAATLSQLSFQRIAYQATSAASAAMATNPAVAPAHSSTVSNSSGSTTFTFTVTAGGPATNTVRPFPSLQAPSRRQEIIMAVTSATLAALSTVANLLALCWFGMWMGMTSRTANLATLKTIGFVQVIPWLVIAFASNIVIGVILMRTFMNRTQNVGWYMWWPLLTAGLGACLAVSKDLFFVLWSRRKLHASLRDQATRGFEHPRLSAGQPAAPPSAARMIEEPPGLPPIIKTAGQRVSPGSGHEKAR